MASFLRARQAGIQNDLSAGIAPGAFNPDELARYGINSQIRYVHTYSTTHFGFGLMVLSIVGYLFIVCTPDHHQHHITP